jgi:hypothetical protein
MAGSFTSARAMATRCSWPLESCRGTWSIRASSPTTRRAVWARFRPSAVGMDVTSSGSSTLSRVVSTGIRL